MTDFRDHHRREAARLRSLATTATTEAIKTRLMEEAEEHERIVQLAEDPEGVEQEASSHKAAYRRRHAPSTALSSASNQARADRLPGAAADWGLSNPRRPGARL